MSIDKITGINSYNIRPDSIKKDSDRNKYRSGDRKVNTDTTVQKVNQAESQKQARQTEPVFDAEAMQKAAQEMKARIEEYNAHIKQLSVTMDKFYPPYPPESEDKVQQLKQYAFFRKEIEHLSPGSISTEYDTMRETSRIPELQAEMKSMEVRNTLTSVKGNGITMSQSKLSELY